MDHFSVLGIRKGASIKTIQSAFRKLAREFHPDKNKDPEAVKKFQKISTAYSILSDPIKREEYLRRQEARVSLAPEEYTSGLWKKFIENKIKEER